ncbi:glycine--tRNA ligase subunit beta, partial [Altererythrobacter sp.]|nr:glycine--tRNA ligase subunit beta [Altererythrobacter sp.]
GTVADKVERVAKLARWLVETDVVTPAKAGVAGKSGAEPTQIPASAGMTKEALAEQAELAARLCKADLVTEMVGEFPELQGLMGGYYARAEGLDDAVADAIRDHYKPVGQGDEVPTSPVTVAVSLADKMDTVIGFFAVNERPTGSKDPFALRRQALAIVALVLKNGLRLSLIDAIGRHEIKLVWDMVTGGDDTPDQLFDFFADRLKVQQREAGVRHDLIDAVFALGGEDDLVRLLARVKALQSFMDTEDGTNLLAGYKRAANILKKEGWSSGPVTPAQAGVQDGSDGHASLDARLRGNDGGAVNSLSYTPEPAEKALIDALDAAEPKAAAAIEAEDFGAAMSALASLRAPIDRFFEDVIVNADEAGIRAARLDLLARFRDAVHRVADFSRIEGGG